MSGSTTRAAASGSAPLAFARRRRSGTASASTSCTSAPIFSPACWRSFAGFFLASEVGFGHPTVGSSYTLTSIAAAVLGGASLAGGRGSFVGAMLGALFFTLIVNIITLLGMSTAFGIIASGALTLFAVFLYSGWQPMKRGWARHSHASAAASGAAGMTASRR